MTRKCPIGPLTSVGRCEKIRGVAFCVERNEITTFGAEPQEEWSKEDAEDFEKHAAAWLRSCAASRIRAALVLLVSILCLLPFTAGHSLNRYWNVARYLVYVTLGCFVGSSTSAC